MSALILDPPHWAQLEQVQLQVDQQVAYASDRQAWGRDEYWEPAGRIGDCEDIVLLKRDRLMKLGWPADALRIAVVQDERGRLHAVLTVDVSRSDGRPETYALDNRLVHVEPWVRLSELGYRWLERSKPGSAAWVSLGSASQVAAVETAAAVPLP